MIGEVSSIRPLSTVIATGFIWVDRAALPSWQRQ
jgi:hypothetical protein